MRGKGIVVEIAAKNRVIVMTSRGEFIRVPFKKPVCVGQEIQYTTGKHPSLWQWSVAAVFFMAVLGSASIVYPGFSMVGQSEAAYFVTVDINPSVELAVNRQQKVVSAEGLNDDGRELLGKVKVVGTTFRRAVEIVTIQAEQDGYLRNGENEVIVTISSDETIDEILTEGSQLVLNRREFSIASELEEAVVETLTDGYQARVRVWKVPPSTREQVRQAGVTPAMYIATYVEQPTETKLAVEPTEVTTTLHSNGQVKQFEFQVNRPVLNPVTWTRQEPVTTGTPNYRLTVQSRGKGDLDILE